MPRLSRFSTFPKLASGGSSCNHQKPSATTTPPIRFAPQEPAGIEQEKKQPRACCKYKCTTHGFLKPAAWRWGKKGHNIQNTRIHQSQKLSELTLPFSVLMATWQQVYKSCYWSEGENHGLLSAKSHVWKQDTFSSSSFPSEICTDHVRFPLMAGMNNMPFCDPQFIALLINI